MSKKTCENCGEPIYNLGCVNCNEIAYIEERDYMIEHDYVKLADGTIVHREDVQGRELQNNQESVT